MSERNAGYAREAASSLTLIESVTLVTVPGLHGSEDAHWQTWLEREMPSARRVEQRDWEAPHLDSWSNAVRNVLAVGGPVVVAAHSFGCLATAHALSRAKPGATGSYAASVKGVLFVAPASPAKFRFAGAFSARRLDTLSLVVGRETDPWMPLDEARRCGAHQHGGGLWSVATRAAFRRNARAARHARIRTGGAARLRMILPCKDRREA